MTMNRYYKILGLEPGASQEEIKKAYFRLIRQHSPESDPEQFQKIREAYERLKNAGDEPEGPVFPPFEEPFAEKMLDQIEEYRSAGDDEKCRDCCEEACRLFPKELRFQYMKVIAQRQCGNTGKAVKSAEKLVKEAPDNKWFQKELAVSYMERGYTQKAYFACEKAYEMGCRDLDFVLMYAMSCSDFGQLGSGVDILLEVIDQKKKWTKEEMPELVECYVGLLTMNRGAANSHFNEIVEKLCDILDQYGIYLAEYLQAIIMALMMVMMDGRNGLKEYTEIKQVLAKINNLCSTDEEKQMVDAMLQEINFQQISEDPRIGDTLTHAYEAYFDLEDEEPALRKFALTDMQLCMVKERQEVLEQAEIIRQDYPEYYEKLCGFLKKLQDETALARLKDRLLKEYNRLGLTCSNGYYYEKYPEEQRKAWGTVISDGMDEPYVRGTKKIGRNAPCPCGSGKKYKHCCMNKQA